jgi:hypothetical protein
VLPFDRESELFALASTIVVSTVGAILECVDLFLWAKTISLIPIVVIWCSVLHLGINNDCWTQWGTFAVLSTNILEAVIIKDALPKPRRRDMDSTECFHWCSLYLI